MDQTDNMNAGMGGGQQPVPNATAILVLGILSIVLCMCYGVIGLILGGIALYLSNQSMAQYNSNPEAYSQSSFKNMKAGRICAIIGLSLSALVVVYMVVVVSIMGNEMMNMPWEEMMREAQENAN